MVAALVGWGLWLGYSANPPTEASGIVQYLSRFLPGVYNGTHLTGSGILLAIVLMLIFVAVNYYGVLIFAKVNLVVTVLKFIVPTLTLIAFFSSGFHPSNFTSHGFAPNGWSAGLSAIATAGIVFAYTGFRAAIDLAGEAVNPRKDVPRAVLTAIVIAMVLYIGLEIIFVGGVPAKDLVHGWSGINFNSPYADLALSMNLMWLYWMIIADAMISPAGSSLVYTASNSRIVYGMAKNRFFPTYFSGVNKKYGIPTRALLLNFVVGLLYLIPLKSWHGIIEITGALGIYTYSAGAVSVLVFRRLNLTKSNQKITGMKVIAPLGFVIGTLIVYWAGWQTLKATLSLLLAGVVLYIISYLVNKENQKELMGGLWLIVYLIAVFVLSKLGTFQGVKFIPAPWDSLAVAAVALLIYYWGVASGVRYMQSKGDPSDILKELEGEVDTHV
jgi:amino acid transporter